MKQHRLHIINQLAALLMLTVFLLPAMVSFVHAASDHRHFDTCKFSGETHMHESQLDCDLGDLQMVKMGVFAFAKAYSLKTPEIDKFIPENTFIFKNTTNEFSTDRGPPVCL